MSTATRGGVERPKPFVVPEYCKGCGRCIDSCPKHCITAGAEINPLTGLVPVHLDLGLCNGCALCLDACPEPYGLRLETERDDYALEDPAAVFGEKSRRLPMPDEVPDQEIALPAALPIVTKGNYASAIGALLAGCRHVFGYPITPSTEGAELMAKVLPHLGGVFTQAPSETATVNMMYGCGGAGLPSMTFTSSPGFSLMLEGISYMIGAEVPGVFVNIMRGGPGLGNIAPEQSDIKLVCRGLGHGNTHAIVLAPASPQEMLDLTMLAFPLSFRYRNPVVVVADGYLGQITGAVTLPRTMRRPGLPAWAVSGDGAHRENLINSIYLFEPDLERHNEHLNHKFAAITAAEQRAALYRAEGAEVLLVAANTPARMAQGAVEELRNRGVKVGLFRPITLWPFPIHALLPLLDSALHLVVVEASSGQLEDELRLALSHAGVFAPPAISHVRRQGGILPQQREIVDHVTHMLGGART
jgi:pyruvate/2-oxoacid:ferredoxin oxidoreductase alpha subunit/NAD-dependent dihydropyrimidine dehydrogenase PreA subunit